MPRSHTAIIAASIAGLALALALTPGRAAASGSDDASAATEALKHGDYDVAIKLYTSAIDAGDLSNDEKEIAYYDRGIAYRNKSEYKKAIADYTSALALKPDDADAYFGRCIAYQYSGDHKDAITDCTSAIGIKSDQPNYYYNRGLAYRDAGDYQPAIADFSTAISMKSDVADYYHDRATAYDDKGDYDRAIADYDAAIRIAPKNAYMYYNRGLSYFHRGAYDHALADYNEATRLDPKDPNPYYNRASIYLHRDEFPRMLSEIGTYLKLQPRDPDAYYLRGDAYARMGDYKNAIADLTTYIRLKPDTYGYLHRGAAFFDAGRYALAAADFDQAIAVDSRAIYAMLWLHLADAKMGKSDGAKLSALAAGSGEKGWPRPVVSMFLGDMTPAQVATAAAATDVAERKGDICENAFYAGEYRLLTGATAAARTLLTQARDSCAHDFIEWAGAKAELERLGR